MEKQKKHRWRGEGAEWRGYVIARVRDQQTGQIMKVYRRHSKGNWLLWDTNDTPVKDTALASTAKRVIESADRAQLHREFAERAEENEARAQAKWAAKFGPREAVAHG